MKIIKTINFKILLSIVLLLIIGTFQVVSSVHASSINEVTQQEMIPPAPYWPGGVLQKYMTASMAQVLGMNTEELQKRLEAGERMWNIAKEKGISAEEFRNKMDEAFAKALDAAVKAGDITQEQADFLKQRMQNKPNDFGNMRPGGRRGNYGGLLWDYKNQALAEVLGITPDELKSRLESGERMLDIISKQGLTLEQFQSKMLEAATKFVNQAVKDGKITQEEANRILELIKNRNGLGLGVGRGRDGNMMPGGGMSDGNWQGGGKQGGNF